MSWTDERIELLKSLWEKGLTASQIAETLGEGVSRNAVIGKAHRLGLKSRPSPVKGDSASESAADRKPEAAPAAPRQNVEPAAERDAAPAQPQAQPAAASAEEDDKPAPRIPIHDPRPAPSPAPPKPARPAPRSEAVKDKTSLLDLNERICKWPIGHPGEADFHFCGKKAAQGFPYCGEHCAVAYQAQLPRRDRNGRAPMPPLPRPR